MLDHDAALLSFIRALAFLPHIGILNGIFDILGGLVLLVIGILIIILVVGILIVFLPAIIVAAVVWFITGSLLLAGIAFLIVAIISLAAI